MNEIVINDTLIKYQIAFKNNKNTYFYFKKNGYIQVNASRYQKKKDILKFIKSNSVSFIKKYNKMLEKNIVDDSYRIWGIKYEVIESDQVSKLTFDLQKKTIQEPKINIDHNSIYYKNTEKEHLLEEANNLREKYLNNGLIDISNITIKTRATSSRFGSCNSRLKSINLNLKLVHYNKQYIEYVFLHEIAHLVHQNHSKDFYLLLEKICPNYKELKRELNQKFKR